MSVELESGSPPHDHCHDQAARRVTLRPHHTPGQSNHSGVEGRRFDRIGDSRTSWQKPAVAELFASFLTATRIR
jgi:hypothetical protein